MDRILVPRFLPTPLPLDPIRTAEISSPTVVQYARALSLSCEHTHTLTHTQIQTRVHAPPGGRSQISIFGGYEEPKAATSKKTETATTTTTARPVVKKGTSANAFATGSNQNCGNFITDRSTTRIHAPPGGKTSISIFGGYPAETKRATPTPLVETKRENIVVSAPAPVVKTTSPVKKTTGRRVSSNVFATGSNQNCGNFITDRPSTRVHAPPGGRSQITFG